MPPDSTPSSDIIDPHDAAETAGLVYLLDDRPGIVRRKTGRGFTYLQPDGRKVADETTLERIRQIAIPPAWTDVWISPDPNGHIQATGRDNLGRKQYRYHPAFREIREGAKFDHMMEFAQSLPAIRSKLSEHMARRGLPREKVLATVVHLLETTLIRVGNDDYAKQNRSYGLTTLQDRHVAANGAELRFQFKGKGGKEWRLRVTDRRIARIVRACQDLPGQELFQYFDEDGVRRDVTSADINAYLKEITCQDITAKDFRTWHGTVMAALALEEFKAFDTRAPSKKSIKAAIEKVASRLGNTPTICRKCYIHPEVFAAYDEGELSAQIREELESELRCDLAFMTPEEAAVLALLDSRLKRTLEHKLQQSVTRAGGTRKGPGSPRKHARRKRASRSMHPASEARR